MRIFPEIGFTTGTSFRKPERNPVHFLVSSECHCQIPGTSIPFTSLMITGGIRPWRYTPIERASQDCFPIEKCWCLPGRRRFVYSTHVCSGRMSAVFLHFCRLLDSILFPIAGYLNYLISQSCIAILHLVLIRSLLTGPQHFAILTIH